LKGLDNDQFCEMVSLYISLNWEDCNLCFKAHKPKIL